MNRSGLVAVGVWVLIVGYAVLYSGLTSLNPKLSPTGQTVGVIDGLIPGHVGQGPAQGSGSPSEPGAGTQAPQRKAGAGRGPVGRE